MNPAQAQCGVVHSCTTMQTCDLTHDTTIILACMRTSILCAAELDCRQASQAFDMLTHSNTLNHGRDSKSALYDLQEASRGVLFVHEPLPGHAHHDAPAHPPKASSELIGRGVPQGFGVQAQKDNGCQGLHTIAMECPYSARSDFSLMAISQVFYCQCVVNKVTH